MIEIILRSKDEDFTVMIDDEDLEKVYKHHWNIRHDKYNKKYCHTYINDKGKKTAMLLHRFIMNLDFGDKRIINHKDGNGLNNQKSNLRLCSARE